MASLYRVTAASVSLFVLAACGGGGGGGGGGTTTPPPPPASYTVGGSVSGLSGSGLVLQNSGGNNLTVAANGSFTFSTAVTSGGTYSVSVFTQPSTPAQTCAVSNGSGTVSANVTNVSIVCTTNTYAVGGSVSGLTGTGLVLQNNGGNNLSVAANGNFAFTTTVASGAGYAVSIATQPSGQLCAVSSGAGTVAAAAVTNVSVSCRAAVAKFIYVPNKGSNTISTYAIDASTGNLTAVGTPVATDVGPTFVSVDPSEKFLYVSNAGSASSAPTVSAYAINATTGVLTPVTGSPFALSTSSPPPVGTASLSFPTIDPATKFEFMANHTDNKLYGSRIDSTTGALTDITGLPTPAFPMSVGFPAFDLAGKYLYVPYTQLTSGVQTGYLAAYQVNATTGALTAIGSPVATGAGAGSLVERHPSGKFLLLMNQAAVGGTATGSISVFSIDSSTGAPTLVTGSPFSTGGPAQIVSFHPTKDFIFALASGSPTASLVIFNMNPTTGVLTSTGAANTTVASTAGIPGVEQTGKFLVITDPSVPGIRGFSIDQTNGALTPVAGSPFAAPLSPSSLRPDPSWKYFYLVSTNTNTVFSFALDSTTGAVTLVSSVATGVNPQYVGLAGRQ